MRSPLVSVVMPVTGHAELLEEAATSILLQSLSDLELIIVDNGADGATKRRIARLVCTDDRTVPLHRISRGLVDALNAGCHAARGRYVARMDADDLAPARRLELQVNRLEADPTLGIIGGQMRCADSLGRSSWIVDYPTTDSAIRSMIPMGNPFAHPAVTMRREVVLAAGGYRSVCPHGEDYELWTRVIRRCRAANLAEVVLTYRIHLGQSAFRSWRAQTLSMVAVQAALRLQEATGVNPLEEMHARGQTIDEVVVAGWGISGRDLRSAYVSSLVSQALLAQRIGEPMFALGRLEQARIEAATGPVRAEAEARLWRVTASLAVARGQWLGALTAALRSVRGREHRLLLQAWKRGLRAAQACRKRLTGEHGGV